MRVLILILACTAILLSPGPVSCEELDWKQIHEKADTTSSEQARALLERELGSVPALYLLGLTLLKEYKIDDAEDVFNRMEQIDPGLTESRWGKAEILRRRHKIGEAEKVLEDIIKKSPGYAPAYITLAYMLFDKNEYGRSIPLAKKVLAMGRKNVDTTNYARAYLTIGGAKAALADEGGVLAGIVQGSQVLGYFKKAQRLQPRSAGVLYGLGSFYSLAPGIAGGDVNKGVAYLERAIKEDPHFTNAYTRLAQVWWKRGNWSKYEFYLNKAQELDPEDPFVIRVRKLGQSSDQKR